MPSPRRVERLQQLIHETAALTIQRDLQDPRLGFVTVTHVRHSPDMSFATVYWSCLGSDAERRTCERALSSARGRVQSVIAGRLGTRVTPQIRFQFDDSLEKAARLEDVFEKLRRERSPEPAAETESPVAPESSDAPPPSPGGAPGGGDAAPDDSDEA